MKHIDQNWTPFLEKAIRTSINCFSSGDGDGFLADLYVYLDEDQMLHFYDDLERELHSVQLEDESETNSSGFCKQLSHSFQQVLQKLEQEGFFNQNFFFKPFTVSLVDRDFIVNEELIFIDDDTVKLDGELLAGLNDELNTFFRDLMEN